MKQRWRKPPFYGHLRSVEKVRFRSAALSSGLSVVINWIKDRYPSTKGLSYKATNYAHKNYTNTYISPIKKYAYRSDFTWYPNKNYKGNTYKETLYFIKQIG